MTLDSVDNALPWELLICAYDTVLLCDAAGFVVRAEGDPLRLLGRTASEILGGLVSDLLLGATPEMVHRHFVERRRGSSICRFGEGHDEAFVQHASGERVAVEGLHVELPGGPVRGALLLRAARPGSRLVGAYARALRTRRVLEEVHAALTGSVDESSALFAVCRALVGECGYRVVWVGLAEHDAEKRLRPVAWAGIEAELVARLNLVWSDTPNGRGPTGTAVRNGETTHLSHEQIGSSGDEVPAPWQSLIRSAGIGSILSVPLRIEGVVVGALSIMAREPDAFSANEVELLEAVTGAVGRACARLRARTARTRTEERLSRLLDDLGVATWTASLTEQRITHLNDAAERVFGRPRDELLAMPSLIPLAHPDDRPELLRKVVLADEVGRAEVDVRLEAPADPPRWLHVIIHPVRDAAGEVSAHETVAFDISERRSTEEALRALNIELELRVATRTAELTDLYENAPCGYHSSDADGCTTAINATFLRLLGYSREELLGRPISELMTPQSVADTWALFERLKDPAGPTAWAGGEREFVRKDGSTFWVLVSGSVVRAASGAPQGFRATAIDITKRKRAEAHAREQDARLAAALEDAQEAARAKDEFLASMSHELRTPLNGILGTTEVIDAEVYGPITEELRAAVGRIEESGRHLLALINDILDVAKVGAGKMVLELGAVDVGDVARASLRLVEAQARRKSLRLTLGGPPDLPMVLADERRLKQILVNLLSNAVKFTPPGGRVGLDIAVEEDAKLRFTVWDTGVGIASADLAKLFRPFLQLDAGLDRQHTGTGLGLALVRELSELHGGSASVQSERGQGARFTVELPLRAPEKTVAHTVSILPSTSLGRPRMVLLVEDDPMNVVSTRDMLQARGHQVHVAENGEEAVRLAKELRPDVLLMDIQMPGLDGLQATQRLRAAPETRALPIIALTALAMPGDRERCLRAGADEYLTKPVPMKALLAAIERLSTRAAWVGVPARVDQPSARKALRLLVADDVAMNVTLIRALAKLRGGIVIDGVKDGEEALAQAQMEAYDLVLMDVQMPSMDGLTASRKLRAAGLRTPIVAMTAESDEEAERAAKAAGMDGVLLKPVGRQSLQEVLDRYLARSSAEPPS